MPLFHKSDATLLKHFLLLNFFLLLFYAPGGLETCVNCKTSCVTPKRAKDRLLHGQMKLDILSNRNRTLSPELH